MWPILFSIGPVNFYSYGFCVSVAFFVSMGIFYTLARPKKLWDKTTFTKLIIVLIYIGVFARLTFFVAYYERYFTHWYEVFYIWNGGLVSYGGIIGMILAFVIMFRPRLWENLDILAVSVLGGGIFWRLGGILAGSYPTKAGSFFWSINGQFPAVELESILLFIGFIIFYFLYKKIKFAPGYIFLMVFGYYGIIRLIIDQYREYPDASAKLNIGQFYGLISIGLAIVSILVLKFIRLKKNKT